MKGTIHTELCLCVSCHPELEKQQIAADNVAWRPQTWGQFVNTDADAQLAPTPAPPALTTAELYQEET